MHGEARLFRDVLLGMANVNDWSSIVAAFVKRKRLTDEPANWRKVQNFIEIFWVGFNWNSQCWHIIDNVDKNRR